MLDSFGERISVAVVGASGGVGGALALLVARLAAVERVLAFVHHGAAPVHPKILPGHLDLTDPASIAAAVPAAPLHLVIVATGLLHDGGLQPERDLRQLDAAHLARLFAINATGPALVAQAFLPVMATGRKTAFAALSARVGSIGDNRLGGWYGYRASKAALNQLIRCLAIEQARKFPERVIVGLHPGTVATGLSEPFRRNVKTLFTATEAAAHLLGVLDRLGPADTGQVFAWDGAAIAP